MSRPPCWPDGQSCPNDCAADHYDRTVHNKHWLPEPWQGWRFAGRELVAPDGERITPERMRGLLWRQAAEARLTAVQARSAARKAVSSDMVTVLRIKNRDWHAEHFGTCAG